MLDQEIRAKIAQYLNGEISLEDLNQWFGPATWDVHLTDNYEALKLTGRVGLWLSEYSAGHLPEDALRYEMRQLLNAPVKVTTGTSSTTIYRQTSFGSAMIMWQGAARSNAEEYV